MLAMAEKWVDSGTSRPFGRPGPTLAELFVEWEHRIEYYCAKRLFPRRLSKEQLKAEAAELAGYAWVRIAQYYDHETSGYDPEKSAIRTWLLRLTNQVAEEQSKHNARRVTTAPLVDRREKGDEDPRIWQTCEKCGERADVIPKKKYLKLKCPNKHKWHRPLAHSAVVPPPKENEETNILHQAIALLPDKERAIMEYHYIDELSDLEIGELYGHFGLGEEQSLKMIKRIRKRAINKLKDIVQGLNNPGRLGVSKLTGLSPGTALMLQTNGVRTAGDIGKKTAREILGFCGDIRSGTKLKRLAEIRYALKEVGLELRSE